VRRHRTAAGILLAVGALFTGGLVEAGAANAAAPHSGSGQSVPARTTSVAEQHTSRTFWTADRMRGATPLDLLLTPRAAKQLKTPAADGRTTTVEPTAAPAPRATGLREGGGGGAVVKTSGRVFFTFQGRTASCSGNAVTSQNASTVITAGHCVKYQGSWHTNWVFVPAYDNGNAPYGQWTATKTLTTPQWEASEDINHDIGAAVVAPLNGRTLTSVVGAQGIQFNGGYNKPMYAFGFPAASPYDGTKLVYCSGNSSRDFLFSQDHSLGCNMTGGSSGGPWFTGFSEATGAGLQVSVNSFGYTFLPNRMFGPYFGNEAKALYDKAQIS
jgi:hypothetical protein